jgi:hypothetical protein
MITARFRLEGEKPHPKSLPASEEGLENDILIVQFGDVGKRHAFSNNNA